MSQPSPSSSSHLSNSFSLPTAFPPSSPISSSSSSPLMSPIQLTFDPDHYLQHDPPVMASTTTEVELLIAQSSASSSTFPLANNTPIHVQNAISSLLPDCLNTSSDHQMEFYRGELLSSDFSLPSATTDAPSSHSPSSFLLHENPFRSLSVERAGQDLGLHLPSGHSPQLAELQLNLLSQPFNGLHFSSSPHQASSDPALSLQAPVTTPHQMFNYPSFPPPGVSSDSIPRASHQLSNSIENYSAGLMMPYTLDDSDLTGLSLSSGIPNNNFLEFESTGLPGFLIPSDQISDPSRDDGTSSPHGPMITSPSHADGNYPSWHSFGSSPSSGVADDERPVSPGELLPRSSPEMVPSSNLLYFTPPLGFRYHPHMQTHRASAPDGLEHEQNRKMDDEDELRVSAGEIFRSGSLASDFSPSCSSSMAATMGVNPVHVNAMIGRSGSMPNSGVSDDLLGSLSDPFRGSWWAQPDEAESSSRVTTGMSSTAETSLLQSVRASMSMDRSVSGGFLSSPEREAEMNAERLARTIFAPPGYAPLTQPPRSTQAFSPTGRKTRGAAPSRTPRRQGGPMMSSPSRAGKLSRVFLEEPDYSLLPTKRSRGRRPPVSPDVGLPMADGSVAVGAGMQAVPGGQAFDPSLNPCSEAVKFCELTKTGKPKKIFVCQVRGCGKCFKRSEHLKRHVRSIHTNHKPYQCPWVACTKHFSRHDNLNQHLRVHRVEEGGDVLNGLHVSSDGVLRSDVGEVRVEPESRGLRNVEVGEGAGGFGIEWATE